MNTLAAPPAPHWHPVTDAAALQQEALATILAGAEQAIAERGQFHLVLAGGQTPRAIYRRLATTPSDWAAWHVYFGDERCLPADDPERNSRMADETWLLQVPIPRSQVHRIPAELGAELAAQRYVQTLQGVGDFDLVLLGLGEDGHTASLFPAHDWGTEPGSPDTLAVLAAPKPPPERVSLSARRLGRARKVLFLVYGATKQGAVAAWRAGQPIAAAAIRPPAGVEVLVQRALLAAPGETTTPEYGRTKPT